MSKYQAYPEYKDSGVEWLGSIPADWSVKRIQETALVISGYPFESKKFDPLVGTPLIRIRDIKAQKTEVFFNGEVPKEALVDSGDVLVGMDGDFNVAMWKSGLAALNQRVACLRTDDKSLQKFLFYVLPFNMKVVNDLTYFTTVKHLSNNDILKTVYALPKRAELINIVNFLDHETAKIDTLIEKQQQLIKLLKEKRQAVISHAVTKGLNPEAPMKDSGVKWLGKVPEHWDVLNLAGVADVIDPNPSHRNPKYTEDGYPFISTVEFIGIDDVETNTPRRVAEETVIEQEQRCRFREGSIAFSRKGTIGEVRILPKDVRFALLDSVCVINAGSRIAYEFLYQQCRSSLFDSQLGAETRGAALKQVSVGRVRGIKTFVPPMSEQKEIVSFLSVELGKLDLLIQKANQGIALMNERRTALISAAVTGKIDVRNWQAPTSQQQALEQTA
ncbi:restriction endonuclease subunit S [Salinivibrio sp. KP-1]|uniref:restriction endonuclease subunit S n=1 Tax=Salinivibrio sp. KP-1 TaxID=1406902 RepID=UPI0006147B20|nr:restriction endonuclease subunit S [Salinivibrio sp. KP-1]KKA44347.1 hypothetical protein WN56_11660 [Salinivibrio sp. KP-1]